MKNAFRLFRTCKGLVLPLAGILLLPVVAFAGPRLAGFNELMLAQVDFPAVHATLINKCKVASPRSVPALTTAISAWSERNSDAINELRLLIKKTFVKNQSMSDTEATKLLAQIVESTTSAYQASIEKTSDKELTNLCEGGYAASSLNSSAVDYPTLLVRVRSLASD